MAQPARDKRGWLTPVGERFELLLFMVETSPVSGVAEFGQSLVTAARVGISELERNAPYDVGLAIQMLDTMRDVLTKYSASLAMPRIKAKAHEVDRDAQMQ
jgi:hypothetical protein